MLEQKQIVYNSCTCLECNETLVSYHRHDYKTCSCPNQATIDGGTEYLRYGAVYMSKIELFTVYADDPFEKVRKYAYRGSRGKDGNEPLTYIPLCKMEDSHLEAVLKYEGREWHLDLIKKEIEFRKMENKLSNQYVKTALAMVHLDVTENVAGLIQDTIHELIKKGEDFDLMTAASLYVKHQDTYTVINELKAQYRILSELYEPKSKHKTQKKIGIMLDNIIKKLENQQE